MLRIEVLVHDVWSEVLVIIHGGMYDYVLLSVFSKLSESDESRGLKLSIA